MKIGVLALQGDVREHLEMLKKCGADTVQVKSPEDIDNIDGLIIPGGESTTIGRLIERNGLDTEIKKKFEEGMPIYGTCAGAILLSKKVIGQSQFKFGFLDAAVVRNAYGRQVDSFETEIELDEIGKFKGVFIRAPVIQKVYNGAKIMGKFKDMPVMIRQGNLLITTFHPELTGDKRIHQYFVNMAKQKSHRKSFNIMI